MITLRTPRKANEWSDVQLPYVSRSLSCGSFNTIIVSWTSFIVSNVYDHNYNVTMPTFLPRGSIAVHTASVTMFRNRRATIGFITSVAVIFTRLNFAEYFTIWFTRYVLVNLNKRS